MLYEYYTEDCFERLVTNTSHTRFISLKFILKVVLNNLYTRLRFLRACAWWKYRTLSVKVEIKVLSLNHSKLNVLSITKSA